LKQRPILALLLLGLLTTAAVAETTKLHIHGFSPDGSKFIFEEFGVSDGSGIPHASLYAIDVTTDSYLDGTPFRSNFTETDAQQLEGSKPDDFIAAAENIAREQLKKLSADFMKTLGPTTKGTVRAQHSPFQLNPANPIRFSTKGYELNYSSTEGTKGWSLDLKPIEFEAKSSICKDWRDTEYGFRLVLTNEETKSVRVLNEDRRVPKSRSCPQNYHIENVITHQSKDVISVAVIVRYASRGFEGYNGRLLAVTGQINP